MIGGLHHVTAIASDPQQNIDFYTHLLGLRLIKVTVNFDDPGTYHLYYGDYTGTPGTILTFFPFPGARRGSRGNGQAAVVSFAVPSGTLDTWRERLEQRGVSLGQQGERFGERVLSFVDPDGMLLELIEVDDAASIEVWEDGPIPAEHAIRGFHSVTLWEQQHDKTGSLLADMLGYYEESDKSSGRFRYQADVETPGAVIDIMHRPDSPRGRGGAGTVHHIAFRTSDDQQQQYWQQEIAKRGFNVTPVRDRQYFHSIYFREPGGVLFEVATDPPGFTLDEKPEALGQELKLPPWLEEQRPAIEQALPSIELPEVES